jgi:hypothetical protein
MLLARQLTQGAGCVACMCVATSRRRGPQGQDKTRQNVKWHLFIYYVLNGYSLFPFQEALVPGSQYLFGLFEMWVLRVHSSAVVGWMVDHVQARNTIL